MATQIYLGNPPENIKKWIKENYKPTSKLTDPLCFTAEEAGSTITMFDNSGSAPTVYLETSPTGEDGSWTDFIVGSTEIKLENVGDKVYFRAKQDNERFAINEYEYNAFSMTGKIAASGNLNTLLKADGSVLDLTAGDIDRTFCYASMFDCCTSLTHAPELPAITLADNCYYRMFSNCISLTQAPSILPAKTLAYSCYEYMFNGCTSLTKAPELPATTLADWCYGNMFGNCKSPFTFTDKTFDEVANLIQNEYLFGNSDYWYDENGEIINPIEIICSDKVMLATIEFEYNEEYGYNEFVGWTLTEKKVNYLCFTAEQANSTIEMTKNSSLAPTVYLETSPTGEDGSWTEFFVDQTIITLPNVGDKVYFRAKQDNERFATLDTYFIRFNMSSGKIAASGNLNTLLKADGSVLDLTGRDYCYTSIFAYCTSLTKAPELPATTLAGACYSNMFNGCTFLTKAPELPATKLAGSCYASMFYGCTSLTQAPELPAETLASSCYQSMFYNCRSLTKAPELPATELAELCYYIMFYNCSSLTQAPELPATELAYGCYVSMFSSCTSLTQASFPNLEKETVATEVVENQEAFYDAAYDIETTCKDGILIVNSTTV